eukprot:2086667-Pleurochrysis_carterae.AAC.3
MLTLACTRGRGARELAQTRRISQQERGRPGGRGERGGKGARADVATGGRDEETAAERAL